MGEEQVEEFWIIPDLWFEDWSGQRKGKEVFVNVCVNVRRVESRSRTINFSLGNVEFWDHR